MQGIVALEKSLSNLAEVLETEGYDVVILEEHSVNHVDAIIVSGSDINLLNMQDSVTEVPVINAVGKTFNEIIEELEKM